jgi:hypothetical protein
MTDVASSAPASSQLARPAEQPAAESKSSEALGLLRQICHEMRRPGAATRSDNWRALNLLCPVALTGAAEILDHKVVTRMVAQGTRREFFLVEASKGKQPHTVLPGFCTCDHYCKKVVGSPEVLVCKHELAVLLADALGLAHLSEHEEAEWVQKFSLAMAAPMLPHGGVVESPGGAG